MKKSLLMVVISVIFLVLISSAMAEISPGTPNLPRAASVSCPDSKDGSGKHYFLADVRIEYSIISKDSEYHVLDEYWIDYCVWCQQDYIISHTDNRSVHHTPDSPDPKNVERDVTLNLGDNSHKIVEKNWYVCEFCSMQYFEPNTITGKHVPTTVSPIDTTKYVWNADNESHEVTYADKYLCSICKKEYNIARTDNSTHTPTSNIPSDSERTVKTFPLFHQIDTIDTYTCSICDKNYTVSNHEKAIHVRDSDPSKGELQDDYSINYPCSCEGCTGFVNVKHTCTTFSDPTCVNPGKCNECKKVKPGSRPLGHDFDYAHPENTSADTVRYKCKRTGCTAYDVHSHNYVDAGKPAKRSSTYKKVDDSNHKIRYDILRECNGTLGNGKKCTASKYRYDWREESHNWENTGGPQKSPQEVRATSSDIYHERKYLQPQQCVCKATRIIFSAWVKENHTGSWVTTKNATCVATGTKKRTCPVCEKKMTASIAINKNNHSWSEWRIAQTPTATTKGKLKRTCTRTGCTAYEMKDIP